MDDVNLISDNMISDDDLPCMVFEFMENGDLADFLRKNDPAILGGKRKQRLNLVNISTVKLF